MGLVNAIVSQYLKSRHKRLVMCADNARQFQDKWIKYITRKGGRTAYGKKYGLKEVRSYEDFKRKIPLVYYEDISNEIRRMMLGERDVLWPGVVKWFSKSSGTTNAKSKFIPISNENFYQCHVGGSWETMALLYHKIPDARMFSEKSLLVGGTLERYEHNVQCRYGDISAIMIHRMPGIGRPFTLRILIPQSWPIGTGRSRRS